MTKSANTEGPRSPPARGPAGEPATAALTEPRPPARAPPNSDPPFVIVAIGASAGGLEACTQLISALPPLTGMAFILVQHLDPSHDSLMAGLLATHTAMTVAQAVDATPIVPEHFYVIPPGTYMSVCGGLLRLSRSDPSHGARLPFDFLLNSLDDADAARTACVVLSGNGTDGSTGLENLRQRGGLAIAQSPDTADYDGMPRAAIATGAIDAVLPIASMPAVLADFAFRIAGRTAPDRSAAARGAVIELLRTTTSHDFRRYKPGTMQRRIERRMEMAAIRAGHMTDYLDLLREDAAERDLLAKDLLINVTGFFRDPEAFDLLAKTVIPDLMRSHAGDGALRIWVAGCSSGEEAYSIAILFAEAIAADERSLKLQLFASDVDPAAIATAREGFYADDSVAVMSADRLNAFFVREDRGYRVAPDLRAAIVFTVQDVLADPPFARLDLVSCRNLLIYLNPAAQARVISLFHFALRPGGILFLGGSETPGDIAGRFELISKQARLYRHIGRARPGALDFAPGTSDPAHLPAPVDGLRGAARRTTLAELCRQAVLSTHAPAAVLIDRKGECHYALGEVERYLRVASGFPTHDLLAMATPALRTKLRAALREVGTAQPRLRIDHNRSGATTFAVDIELVTYDGEELLLVCFVDQAEPPAAPSTARGPPADDANVDALRHDLDVARNELELAHRTIDQAAEDQKIATEEALSVNEEYQAANEELLTSKEELQSLNEELTALNSQLQETIDRERTSADDLQNVLYSTDIATLFLDRDLNIRFFTPTTRALFAVIPGDVGRPITDLRSLATDSELVADARAVLAKPHPIEREIETPEGKWFVRRILPYRAAGDRIEGVVITFTDITERRETAEALQAARKRAELADQAKSRFLAAASHDLRQPLQSLSLVQALLAQTIEDEKPAQLVARLGQTLAAMSGMLNALLDINQIEAGVVQAKPVAFPIGGMLDRLRDEFAYAAAAKRLNLHIVASSLMVRSDPRLLEQMIRNLLTNALKYTRKGKVLVGCRRIGEKARLEIWDTGIGIVERDLHTIFEEFHQLDNAGQERRRGFGLGLAIVQRLGGLLGHEVGVRSIAGKGSVFSIDLPRDASASIVRNDHKEADSPSSADHRRGKVVIVEDDPEVAELLELLLKSDGYTVKSAPDGATALKLVAASAIRPEIILADYDLPGDLNGLVLLERLRAQLRYPVRGIILSGDISTATLDAIADGDCVQLSKPVNAAELSRTIADLINQALPTTAQQALREKAPTPTIFVVDDDASIRRSIREVLEQDGRIVADFADAEAFLAAYRPGTEACLLLDAYLPGIGGIGLLEGLRAAHDPLPTIVFTGKSDVTIAVKAMRAGASDFIEKPVGRDALLASIARALRQSHAIELVHEEREAAARHLAGLTERQHEVLDMVLAGHPSKNIAADLGISQRTVENHRAAIMRKTGAKSLPELARLAVAAAPVEDSEIPAS